MAPHSALAQFSRSMHVFHPLKYRVGSGIIGTRFHYFGGLKTEIPRCHSLVPQLSQTLFVVVLVGAVYFVGKKKSSVFCFILYSCDVTCVCWCEIIYLCSRGLWLPEIPKMLQFSTKDRTYNLTPSEVISVFVFCFLLYTHAIILYSLDCMSIFA